MTNLLPATRLLVPVALAAVFATTSCSTSTFDATDTNADGRLSTGEVEELLLTSIFEAEDSNRDGKVSAEEWKANNPEDDIAIFKTRDLDGDGFVTMEEFRNHSEKSGLFDKFLAQLDSDSDGTVSAADVETFKKKNGLDSES